MLLATASPHSTMRTLRKMSIDQVAFVDPGIGGAAPTDATTTSAHDSRSILCVGLPIERGAAYLLRYRYHGRYITAVPWWQYCGIPRYRR